MYRISQTDKQEGCTAWCCYIESLVRPPPWSHALSWRSMDEGNNQKQMPSGGKSVDKKIWITDLSLCAFKSVYLHYCWVSLGRLRIRFEGTDSMTSLPVRGSSIANGFPFLKWSDFTNVCQQALLIATDLCLEWNIRGLKREPATYSTATSLASSSIVAFVRSKLLHTIIYITLHHK